jgi:hypothetical protein
VVSYVLYVNLKQSKLQDFFSFGSQDLNPGCGHVISILKRGLCLEPAASTKPLLCESIWSVMCSSLHRHLLIAFGGLAGLEESIEEDINLKV